MKKQLFNELLESVREGGAILRGEREASRTFSFEESDVQRLRQDRLAKECAKLQGLPNRQRLKKKSLSARPSGPKTKRHD